MAKIVNLGYCRSWDRAAGFRRLGRVDLAGRVSGGAGAVSHVDIVAGPVGALN